MIQNIIVEGVNASGKSTLVKKLKVSLNWDSKCLNHSKGDQFERYLAEYSNNYNVVFDRSHYSEIVYGKLLRNQAPFSITERRILDTICEKRMLVIYCSPNVEIIRDRYKQRMNKNEPPEIKFDEIDKVHKEFHKVFSKAHYLHYKAKNLAEMQEFVEKIKKLVNNSKMRH